MDIRNPTRFRPAERFTGDMSSAASPAFADEELTEDDIFSFVDFSVQHSRNHSHPSSSPSSSPSPSPSPLPSFPLYRHRASSTFSPPEASSSGILAALPNNDPHHLFNHKTSASSSSSSSAASLSPSSISASRMIPSIPRPPLNKRFTGKHHQSAPVNVPILSNLRRRGSGFVDDNYDDEEEEEEEEEEAEDEVLRPPHEIVARRSERVACSVLEGAGRTLKGRDLRQVRNAVWRQTGFLD